MAERRTGKVVRLLRCAALVGERGAACWDKDMLQLFVDGKLIAWQIAPRLSRFLGPELGIGGPGMELDDLRISDIVRYRQPVPTDAE